MNVAVAWPAGTVTRGTDAASSINELPSVTAVPPAGAAPLSVTVHVDELPLPPAITEGLHVTEVGVCAEALHGSSTAAMSPRTRAAPDRLMSFFTRTLAS